MCGLHLIFNVYKLKGSIHTTAQLQWCGCYCMYSPVFFFVSFCPGLGTPCMNVKYRLQGDIAVIIIDCLHIFQRSLLGLQTIIYQCSPGHVFLVDTTTSVQSILEKPSIKQWQRQNEKAERQKQATDCHSCICLTVLQKLSLYSQIDIYTDMQKKKKFKQNLYKYILLL